VPSSSSLTIVTKLTEDYYSLDSALALVQWKSWESRSSVVKPAGERAS